ncbi:hypothetical protein [Brevundimonas sp.]|jgi:hypothetical protein|uniref:hypothetical protein n=1 Tax=Brevundimonas sp. TaxID=1871086 RepID=UPI0037C09E47
MAVDVRGDVVEQSMLVTLTIAGLMGLQTPTVGLVSYEEAVRCAGLTQAASELEGGESAEGKSLYDSALYWSLAAMQAATAAGKPTRVAEADQTRARIEAVRQLNAEAPAARTALQRCRQKTPDLD